MAGSVSTCRHPYRVVAAATCCQPAAPRRRGGRLVARDLGALQRCDAGLIHVTPIALLAADLHLQYKLATADAIVYATARKHGAELLTCDVNFKGLPGVVLHSKVGRI